MSINNSLTYLYLQNNKLTHFDLNNNKNLYTLYLQHNLLQ